MAVKEIKTTCAYCGAGCQLMFTVDQESRVLNSNFPIPSFKITVDNSNLIFPQDFDGFDFSRLPRRYP
ncbi:MAG: hypothetical protein LBG90_00005 [Spirochaetaceae bacterium]|nr:hypothetical protein [Spirochaetaceae bacterium]